MQNFNELNLSTDLRRAMADMGFEKPTPIQESALPILLGEPTDFLGLAATGTGKTAAYAIPLLEGTQPSRRAVQSLVLCPTRELALQVSDQINLLGKYMNIRALTVYGGASFLEQKQGLSRGMTVVVGTPGRILDHIRRGSLSLSEIDRVILDEADEMISMGFKEDIESILGSIPERMHNIWLFSATMSPEVRKVADEYLNSPQQVQVNLTQVLPESVEQIFYVTQEANKPEVLCKLIDAASQFYGLIFCQTKALVVDLTQYLMGRGYQVDSLHGDMDQNARERTVKAFRDRKVKTLICTDVASRGLDVKDVTHVINYSIPRELDLYIHRIGRTARNGKAGFALSLVTASHRGLIPRIERLTKRRMKQGKIPTRKEIGEKKVNQILDIFQKQSAYHRSIELMGKSWAEALKEMTSEEIAGRFLTLMFPEVFSPREEIEAIKSAKHASSQMRVASPGVLKCHQEEGKRRSETGGSEQRRKFQKKPFSWRKERGFNKPPSRRNFR